MILKSRVKQVLISFLDVAAEIQLVIEPCVLQFRNSITDICQFAGGNLQEMCNHNFNFEVAEASSCYRPSLCFKPVQATRRTQSSGLMWSLHLIGNFVPVATTIARQSLSS